MIRRCITLLLLAVSAPTLLPAQDAPPARRGQPDGVNVGIMMGYRSPIYVGENHDTVVFPGLSIKKGPYYWNGPTAGADLWTLGPVTVGPQLIARWQDFNNDDHPLLEGLEEPDLTLEGGLRARIPLGYTILEFQGHHDLLDRHDGGSALAVLRLAYPIRKGLLIGIAGGARYHSAKKNAYYFGVPTDRARADRPAYSPGSTLHPEAQTMLTTTFNEAWSVRWTNRIGWLDEGIRNSPIVDENIEIRSLIGITYRFF